VVTLDMLALPLFARDRILSTLPQCLSIGGSGFYAWQVLDNSVLALLVVEWHREYLDAGVWQEQ
jgi:hypothetical protein